MRKSIYFIGIITFLPYSTSFCPEKCFCDNDVLEASCIDTNLEVMPMTLNPSMKTLILRNNNFHSVDASMNFYQELELVDLSSNHLVFIPDRAFSNQRRLVELRINSNKISELSERTFSGLGKLQFLNLGENLIESIPNKAFRSLRLLKELKLGSNRISEIENRAFVHLVEVKIIDLSDNLLENIPTEALQYLAKLAELNLANNNLKLISDQSLPQLFKLSVLDLSGNEIERIHEKAFIPVNSVRQLNLQDNQLYEVPSKSLKSFLKLEDLNIGQNKFSVISEGAFTDLGRLSKLDISGCSYLEEVTKGAFSALSDIEYLRLSSNRKLHVIHPEAFQAQLSLTHLDLSNNALEFVSQYLVPWMSLSSVDLSGNPWNCDCQNSFLKRVIINTVNNSEAIRIVQCWNPPSLRDRDIAFLNFDCEVVLSSNTDQSAGDIDNTAIIAVICSSVIVISILILTVMIKSRKLVNYCINSTFSTSDNPTVKPSKVLQYQQYHPYQEQYQQYQPYQEPRYVSQYPRVQTLKPVLTVNPYQNHQTLFRHDQYFLTLAGHEKGIYQEDKMDPRSHTVDNSDHEIFVDKPCEERIYQSLDD